MANRAIITEQVVNAVDIDGNHLKCPRCSGRTLVLYGNSQIPRRETMVEGAIEHVEVDKEQHRFELEKFECIRCQVRFLIKPAAQFELEKQNLLLRELIIEATGKDPFGIGLTC